MKPSHTAIFLAFSGKFLGPPVHHDLPDKAFSLFNNIKALGLNFEVIVACVSIDVKCSNGKKTKHNIKSIFYQLSTYILSGNLCTLYFKYV